MTLKYTLLAMLFSLGAFAQGYKIDFHVKGIKDTTVLLGYYYGETTYVRDTAKVNADGIFVFDGKNKLDQGVYFLILGSKRQFEFVVSDNQRFAFETDRGDYIRKMKVKGDEDNRLFFENMVFNMERHKEAEPYVKIMNDSTLKEDQKKEAREAFSKISTQALAHQNEIIDKYPATLTARLLKVTRPLEIPDPPKLANGQIDSTFQLRYYRAHFFDNFDLADDALIRLPKPFYQQKLDEYLDKLFIQTPDTLMAAIDAIALRAKKNQETYKYLVWSCVYKYQRPTIMGLDEVYVRLYDKYYASGVMDFWVTPTLKKSMKEYAEKLRGSLIGKTGANLMMQDQSFQARSMYDIKSKYVIIYFFDPDCGHCREETPRLVDFYTRNKARFNLEVFAVSADTSMAKMRTYIKEMKMTWVTVNGPRSFLGAYGKSYYAETTPTMYVLDDKKKIIAKGLAAQNLEGFLNNYEKYFVKKSPKGKGTQ